MTCAPRHFPVALCAVECGRRRGEIVNMKWSDIDFSGRSVAVRESGNRKQMKLVMTERLTSVMRSLKCREHCEHVFLNRNGNTYQDFISAHRRAMKRAGLEEARKKEQLPALRFHDLSHACGTLLGEHSGSLALVATQLGHSSLDMTKRYAHVTGKLQGSRLSFCPRRHAGIKDIITS